MVLLGDKAQVMLDWCMIGAKRSMEAQVEVRFGPFGESANLDTR
jgi:hypothetical protein